MKKQISFLSIILLLTCILGCKCKKTEITDCFEPTNPLCKNYDPCYGKKPVSADFIMEQGFGIFIPDVYVELEDKMSPRTTWFTAKEENAKYTWYLGSEVITEKKFSRNFVNENGKTIQISLVVEKEPNTQCFPNESGKDSISKSFYIINDCLELDIGNTYKMALTNNPTDSFICELRFGSTYMGVFTEHCDGTYIKNVDNKGYERGDLPRYSTLNTIMITDGAQSIPVGEFKLDPKTKAAHFKFKLYKIDYESFGRALN